MRLVSEGAGSPLLWSIGERAKRREETALAVGGFVVPGIDPPHLMSSGEEENAHVPEQWRPGEKARSAARPWQRSQAEAAEADQAAHAIRTLRFAGVDDWELEELDGYFPDLRVAVNASSFVVVAMSLGLVSDFPSRATLFLEVPRRPWDGPTRPLMLRIGPYDLDPEKATPPTFARVPPLRAWARWLGGWEHGMPIHSHHEYPDYSMCACMPHNWIRGRDTFLTYAGFCTSWVVKVLFDREYNFYPGPQHTQPWIRIRRSHDEFCGCGRPVGYQDCCWPNDRLLSERELAEQRASVHGGYLDSLRAQRRPLNPLRGISG